MFPVIMGVLLASFGLRKLTDAYWEIGLKSVFSEGIVIVVAFIL